ncbi:uncharacterized protein M421DRAFT_424887 [Didymella exigua CBS 183.55]|uniref:Uncharacterized protein n=1 Tax=Didymella exigua CBS 183.55 TaxID=1150837 RepID=A0A6A5RC96_9PLEO|nr:uncharacterized protein M421DRAFT_424887 [Didymella exigua CBS 183.55]KAF1924246.1 hypothetical protein M421DRAFT_424887 [Didymella exigua CBS 183.55]
MSNPINYSFYGTTVPVLRSIFSAAISIVRTAKDEQSKGGLPSEQEVLDSTLGDMLPFRMQPILLAKFSLAGLDYLKLPKAEVPAFNPAFKTLDEVITFFEGAQKALDSIDEAEYTAAAAKSCDIAFGPGRPTLSMTALDDYFHNFVIPNSYFHLNTMYMLLRNAGFKLGKSVYIGSFMSEQQKKDWAPLSQ